MHVEFTEEVTVTGTASVSIDDISSALSDALESVEYGMEHSDVRAAKAYLVQRFVSHCFQCLSSITDEMVAEVSEQNRKLIFDELQQAANKWQDNPT